MAKGSHLRATAGCLAALLLCGCAGGGDSPTLSLPEMPKMADLTAAIPDAPESDPTGSATELYTRIARGAVGCWFGAEGGMKKDYIYHAEADAPSRGGKAEIVVHVRDPSQANPRGAKAYRIKIDPKDETSAVLATENLKMPEPMAASMTADVNRWARGEHGCQGATTAAGWSEQEALAKAAAAEAQAKTKSAKAKTETKTKDSKDSKDKSASQGKGTKGEAKAATQAQSAPASPKP